MKAHQLVSLLAIALVRRMIDSHFYVKLFFYHSLEQLSCLHGCSNQGCCDPLTGDCICNPGFALFDCSLDESMFVAVLAHSSLTFLNTQKTATFVVNAFTNLNSSQESVWTVQTGAGWAPQAFGLSQAYITNSELALTFDQCTSNCYGQTFLSGGAYTQSASYGYGIYTATMQAANSTVLSSSFPVPNRKTPPPPFFLSFLLLPVFRYVTAIAFPLFPSF